VLKEPGREKLNSGKEVKEGMKKKQLRGKEALRKKVHQLGWQRPRRKLLFYEKGPKKEKKRVGFLSLWEKRRKKDSGSGGNDVKSEALMKR